MSGFGRRLAAAVAATGPLCAGIDPSAELLRDWGLPDDATGLREAGVRCVEAFAGVVAAVKPQVAFFERHGSAGFAALEGVLAEARQAGLLVIADAKRGDIGSTAAAYAAAWLDGSSPLAADAVTTVPYLGLGALSPLLDAARDGGRGVFVVVRSSNPEGRVLQEALTADGVSVEDGLLAALAELNRAAGPAAGAPGPFGAVVGTRRDAGRGPARGRGIEGAAGRFDLAKLGGMFLVPGLGAQGGTASDVASIFAGCPSGTVLPSASRSVLAAGPSVTALRTAALRAREELAVALL